MRSGTSVVGLAMVGHDIELEWIHREGPRWWIAATLGGSSPASLRRAARTSGVRLDVRAGTLHPSGQTL
jgi:hypothetical protein